jgi:arsenate reductase
MADMSQPNILVLCTGNSCRSQMAEGLFRALAGDRFSVHSAGTDPAAQVHPLAVRVMAEAGIDISAQQPKHVREFLGKLPVRYLVIVCAAADQECPRIFPGMGERLSWPFDDPAGMKGTDEEILSGFRRVRDEIREKITRWLAEEPS